MSMNDFDSRLKRDLTWDGTVVLTLAIYAEENHLILSDREDVRRAVLALLVSVTPLAHEVVGPSKMDSRRMAMLQELLRERSRLVQAGFFPARAQETRPLAPGQWDELIKRRKQVN
jgi:hypothetical protein